MDLIDVSIMLHDITAFDVVWDYCLENNICIPDLPIFRARDIWKLSASGAHRRYRAKSSASSSQNFYYYKPTEYQPSMPGDAMDWYHFIFEVFGVW